MLRKFYHEQILHQRKILNKFSSKYSLRGQQMTVFFASQVAILSVYVYPASPSPCFKSKSMLLVYFHAACLCPCGMSMSMLHVHAPCPCSMSLLHILVRTACPCPCPCCMPMSIQGRMSISMLHVPVHDVCTFEPSFVGPARGVSHLTDLWYYLFTIPTVLGNVQRLVVRRIDRGGTTGAC
jgi:hypothetical protein